MFPTFDITGAPLHFEVPGQAVALPCLPSTLDSLISVGRLFEAGYKLDFRLPADAITDNVDLDIFPRYGGTIVTPSSRIIHMIYDNYTWTLPVEPHFVSSVARLLICTILSVTHTMLHIVSHTPNKVLPLPALPLPITSYPDCCLTALCQCSACVHSKGRMNFCQRRPACKCTKCMAFYNTDGTWNEAWASWSVSKPSWTPPPAQQWQPLSPVFDPPPALAPVPIGFIHALRRAVYSKPNLRAVTSEESDLQFTLLPSSDVLLT
jgi:hypothetical protein